MWVYEVSLETLTFVLRLCGKPRTLALSEVIKSLRGDSGQVQELVPMKHASPEAVLINSIVVPGGVS